MVPEYFIAYVSPDSKTGIYHAVYEKDNGNEVEQYKRYGIKVLAKCGNRFHPMDLVANLDGRDIFSENIYAFASTGWRPCRICWMGWDKEKEYERLNSLLKDDWETFWSEVAKKEVDG